MVRVSDTPTSELRERVLTLDAEWRKQEADPQNYRYGKHVYPAKVMPADLHVLVDERAALQSRIAELEEDKHALTVALAEVGALVGKLRARLDLIEGRR